MFYKTAADIPREIALFPLAGALLLPRGVLPLNIFEPRYLNMIDDALAGSRLIGMIQPRTDAGTSGDEIRLHDIGCVGRITSFTELAGDAPGMRRLLVSLTGLCRFRRMRDLAVVNGFRRTQADYAPFRGDLEDDPNPAAVNRERLLDVLRRYLNRHNLQADWEAITRTPNDQLVTTLSIISPYGVQEKQALLEAPDSARRSEILIALTEMALAEGGGGKHSMQ